VESLRICKQASKHVLGEWSEAIRTYTLASLALALLIRPDWGSYVWLDVWGKTD
jgi:hypothetical protein